MHSEHSHRPFDAVLCRRFAVAGMTCSHCERAVTAQISKLAGVVKVTADVAAGFVTVECSRPLDHAEVAAAIDAAGYELAS